MSTLQTGQFTATGQSAALALISRVNLEISGVGTVQIERRVQGAATWIVVSKNADGSPASYIISASSPLAIQIEEIEGGVEYRLNCTAFTSTITWRFGQ